jgi:hypothetical protein
MFRAFARQLLAAGVDPRNLFLYHPADLVAVLELAWDHRFDQPTAPLGGPFHRSDLNRFEDSWFGRRALTPPAPTPPLPPLQPDLNPLIAKIAGPRENPTNLVTWDHLIYAYMIENTRIYEIFRRVVYELTHGEKLGAASVRTQHWLRNTEELFYRDPPPLFVSALNSWGRPDIEGTRRTAYYRVLGMDLNHGGVDNKPSAYARPEAANKEFVSTLEELLREVWVGMINASNTSGAKATDNAKLIELIQRLHDMLTSRRLHGALSREEFAFVSMLSWFHLTLEFEEPAAPVVVDLRAEAASPEQRLYKIAQQVGAPAHGLAGSYFKIAEPISRLLLLIETGIFAVVPGAVAALYTPGTTAETLMRTVITHWSIITGRDIKGGKVVPSDGLRAATAPIARATDSASGNGLKAPISRASETALSAARNGSS